MSNWETKMFVASDLTNKIRNKEIKVPPYQRGQVWKSNQKDSLIDSIKRGYPFGTLLLYERTDNTYLLIDGLQRSTTIYEYLFHPAKFFKEKDLTDEVFQYIYHSLNCSSKSITSKNVASFISDWVKKENDTLEDLKSINTMKCAEGIIKNLKLSDSKITREKIILDIMESLMIDFQKYRLSCEEMSNVNIPAIIYKGPVDDLPEVFKRINSKGTVLSKYQILSATWTPHEYRITRAELFPLIEKVNRFYVSMIEENFDVDGYDQTTVHQIKSLNLYQILFGLSKFLSNKYPYLFNKSKNDNEIDSCGFNLVNACVGNRNSKLSNLPFILEDIFQNDNNKINDFLVNIIYAIDDVYKLLKPYLEFKLNKRKENAKQYHSELQMCSIISNYFNACYATYTYDEKSNSISKRYIKTDSTNKQFANYKTKFKNNVFKKYLIDILNNKWSGSGDNQLDEVSLNSNYYTEEITKENMNRELEVWIHQMNSDRNEKAKVSNPGNAEKILLSVIYSHSFSAFDQNDDINYDIEHLAPKKSLKRILDKLPKNQGEEYALPISSFANLCLLREEVNRKKKDKTLYQDDTYRKILKEKGITLEEIEEKFSFTSAEDLEWINNDFADFNSLREEYLSYLNKRFNKQKHHILCNLFPDTVACLENNTYVYANDRQLYHYERDTKMALVNEYEGAWDIDVGIGLKGWKKDIFDIINEFENDSFSLSDLYSHYDDLKKIHPNNHEIDAKTRQVLQQLRDLKLLEFKKERGKYKRLWKKQ